MSFILFVLSHYNALCVSSPLLAHVPNLSPSLAFLYPIVLLSFKSDKTQALGKSDSPTYLPSVPTPSLLDAAEMLDAM